MKRKWKGKLFLWVFGWREGRQKDWWDPGVDMIFVFFFPNKFRWLLFLFCHFFCFNRTSFYNKGIWVNLYKHFFFPSLHFSTPNQTKRREIKIFSILSLFHPSTIFYSLTFPLLQPNELLNNVGQLSILFFFRNKHTHTQEREKGVLIQRHTTTPLKNHCNFLKEGETSYTTHNTMWDNYPFFFISNMVLITNFVICGAYL